MNIEYPFRKVIPAAITFRDNSSVKVLVINEDERYMYGIKDNVTYQIDKAYVKNAVRVDEYTDAKNSESGTTLLIQHSPTKLLDTSKTVMATGEFQYGTVVPPNFPTIPSEWFYTGFPEKVSVADTKGKVVDFIPMDIYANQDGEKPFILGSNNTPPADTFGYLDHFGTFVKTLDQDITFKKGDYLFTILLDKSYFPQTTLVADSYWELLTEFSGIDPGSTASKTISLTSGISKTETSTLGMSIGATVGFEAGGDFAKVKAELSVNLSTSFSTSVEVNQSITTTDTVEFKAQPREQRIATYQYYEGYTIRAGQDLINYINGFNQTGGGFGQIIKASFTPTKFPYPTKYFRKAYVLEPENN